MYFNFNKDISYAKIVLGMSNEEISNFIGISRMSLNRWNNNASIPSYEALEKMYNSFYDSGINLNRIKEEMYGSSLENNHVLLFYGAKSELNGDPSIEFSDDKKDFGKGFYLGENFEQSASFVVGYKKSSVYIFDFDKSNIKIKEYNVSKEWMILIAYFRGRLEEYKDSGHIKRLLNNIKDVDVIIAPIANNTMYSILDDFINGKITDLQCLNALSANRLGKQYVFLNDKAINQSLKILERCFYCEHEKNDYKSLKLKEDEIGKNKVLIALREYAGKGHYIEDLLK